MDESEIWSVDSLAARSLLGQLGLDADDAAAARVAAAFAAHRREAYGWAAERVQGNLIRALEEASTALFGRKPIEWTEGFRAAEETVIGLSASALLGLGPRRSRSTGQVLRSLVRRSRDS